jgi:hypothetical protein
MDEKLTRGVVNARFGAMMTRTFTFGEVTALVAGNDDWLGSWLALNEGAA